jgi:hypothetical protein
MQTTHYTPVERARHRQLLSPTTRISSREPSRTLAKQNAVQAHRLSEALFALQFKLAQDSKEKEQSLKKELIIHFSCTTTTTLARFPKPQQKQCFALNSTSSNPADHESRLEKNERNIIITDFGTQMEINYNQSFLAPTAFSAHLENRVRLCLLLRIT